MSTTLQGEIGARLVLSAIAFVKDSFFKGPSGVKKDFHYVDWRPRILQLSSKVASTFWESRREGFFTGLAAFSGIGATAFTLRNSFRDMNFLGVKGSDMTKGLCDFIPFATKNNCPSFSFYVVTLATASVALGCLTTFCCGAHQLMNEYIAHRRSMALNLKPIFHSEVEETIDELIDSTYNLNQQGGFFQNLLLYGPPGTGKTMISRWIAKNSNMNYIMLSGADLVKTIQTKTANHITELRDLFDHASNLKSPTIVFIDEAESFCADRKYMKQEELVQLLNEFLNRTSDPSSKIMIVLATNRMEDLDPAVLSRMDCKLFIDLPRLVERKQIIKMHLPIFFTESQRKSLFTERTIDEIAKMTEGLSGRSLFKLLNRFGGVLRKEHTLTHPIIDKTIQRFIKQEQQADAINKNGRQSGSYTTIASA